MINNKTVNLLAEKYGFDECEVVSAEPFLKYKEDLDYNNYGEDFDIKYNPKDCLKTAMNIIVLMKSYKPYDKKYFTADHIYVDSYYTAANESYFRAKLMSQEINELIKDSGMTAMFSPDIPFRHSAIRAGLGKRGMNGLLINEKYGSYTHIQCILTDISLDITSHNDDDIICSDCSMCMTACRAGALDGTGRVELKNCIRHYMPAKRYVPVNIRELAGSGFIGCTACREVCRYNFGIESVRPPDDLLDACYMPILADSEHPLHTKYIRTLQDYLGKNEVRPARLLKSVVIIMGNTGDKKYLDILSRIRQGTDDEELEEYAGWAIDKISKI